MPELDLPYLVYTKNDDGSRTYFYANTTAEKESKFWLKFYHDREIDNCQCPVCLEQSNDKSKQQKIKIDNEVEK